MLSAAWLKSTAIPNGREGSQELSLRSRWQEVHSPVVRRVAARSHPLCFKRPMSPRLSMAQPHPNEMDL